LNGTNDKEWKNGDGRGQIVDADEARPIAANIAKLPGAALQA